MVPAPPLADGPAMYLGGSIMTFALPLGAFIAAALALYLLFIARHSGPRLKYLGSPQVSSIITREPGPALAPPPARAPAPPPPPAAEAPEAPEADGGET